MVPSGIDCCLSNLINNKKGDSSIIHAMEWDESNYGYDNAEIHVFALYICMISNIRINDGYAIGSITRKKIQSMSLIKDLNKFH